MGMRVHMYPSRVSRQITQPERDLDSGSDRCEDMDDLGLGATAVRD